MESNHLCFTMRISLRIYHHQTGLVLISGLPNWPIHLGLDGAKISDIPSKFLRISLRIPV